MQDAEFLNGQDGSAFNEPNSVLKRRVTKKTKFTILFLPSILTLFYSTGVLFALRADHKIFVLIFVACLLATNLMPD
jgi:hypothetical protein